MAGNIVIGTGVMAVPGTLSDISASLQVSVPQAGLLITAGALLMGLGAPLFAGLVASWDRRRLLTANLIWYAVFMLACAAAPSYGWLLLLRVLAVVPPAIFTPQAAACVGLLVPDAQRGRAITFVFLGWSVASVAGMPLSAWIGGTWGWRWAFALVALMSVACAAWVWRAMPEGVRPPALSGRDWARTLQSPVIMLAVAVTAVSSFGQFTLFAYFAPYYREVMGASASEVSLLFLWFGIFGLLGNVLVSRRIDRLGASKAVLLTLGAMALGLALWPLGSLGLVAQALVLVPWALGCFSGNSAQQARLVHLAPTLAPATVALNTSAIYGGQAMGAALGGALIAQGWMRHLHAVGMVLMLLAMATSVWAARLQKRSVGSK